MSEKRKGIQSVEIGLGVLDALVAIGRPSSLSEIARKADLSTSQAHRYLASFVNAGYVRQDDHTTLYDLAGGALQLGLSALARMDVLEEANIVAKQIVEDTGRTVQISVWANSGPTIVRWYPGSPPIYTTLTIGSHLSVTHSATGRVFLAFLNESYVSDVLQRELVEDRTTGAVDIEAIRQQVRRDLVAGVDGSVVPDMRAYAAPVFNVQGQIVLVLCILNSAHFAMEQDGAMRERVLQAGRQLTLRLGGRWPEPRLS